MKNSNIKPDLLAKNAKEFGNVSVLAKKLGFGVNNFKNPIFRIVVDIIYATLYYIERGGPSFNIFKEEILSKRDNPIEYWKALIKFAQQ